jgi:hypothetical protein
MRILRTLAGFVTTATLVSGGWLANTPPALSETLDEYKQAAQAQGCGLIPFQSLRSDCESARRDVDATGELPSPCSKEAGIKADRVKDHDQIGQWVENAQKKLDARQKEADIFERARQTLRNEADEGKRQYAEQSAKKIEDWQPQHKDQIEGLKTNLYYCKELYKLP